MIAKPTLPLFALLTAFVVAFCTSEALAVCASCGVPTATYSAAYVAPVSYQVAYAPATYTTAYAPTYTTYSSGWYPGYWLGRVNRSIWGYPTTTYYAPTYTAAYAPSYSYASYAPACSSCSAGYAPACSTCSTCTASYVPACSTCGTCSTCGVSYAPVCDACAVSGSTCATCAAGSVTQATYTETVAAPASTTYGTTSTANTEPTPALSPNANVPPERTTREAEKPATADPPLQPEPKADADDASTTNIEAPQLFDPNDHTAQHHPAPVWTAVYHKTVGSEPKTQTVSFQQAEIDAEGWTSASE